MQMGTGPTYRDAIERLSREGVAIRELPGPGRVAVAAETGHIAALALAEDEPNLVWLHPEVGEVPGRRGAGLPGGFGGDRLWFAPECAYFWKGEPDWVDFSNNATLPEMDPGNYHLVDVDGGVGISGDVRLAPFDGGPEIAFAVERDIRPVTPPYSASGIGAIGVETSHRITLRTRVPAGRLDLWHLLQVQPWSTLIVPLRGDVADADAEAVVYTGSARPTRLPDQLRWTYTGTSKSKFGVSARATTGRTAIVRALDADRRLLLIRDFPVDPAASYVDDPYGAPRGDVAIQVWDGFGFGEMEFHGPGIAGEPGHVYEESDRIWAFVGTPAAVTDAARELLAVGIRDLV
jgi:hypothetical protein